MSEHPFKKGDRVRLSQYARDKDLFKRDQKRRGVVSKDPNTPHLVSIKWDDLKSSSAYHVDFVELDAAGSAHNEQIGAQK